MTKVYLQAGVYSTHVGQTGHTHVRGDDNADPDQPMVIDCLTCEPHLVREGAVYDPVLVPLTDRQQREQERITREGSYAMNRAAQAMAEAAAGVVAAGHPAMTAKRVRRVRQRA